MGRKGAFINVISNLAAGKHQRLLQYSNPSTLEARDK